MVAKLKLQLARRNRTLYGASSERLDAVQGSLIEAAPLDEAASRKAALRKLAAGLEQRVKALNAFLHDVYHEQAILRAGHTIDATQTSRILLVTTGVALELTSVTIQGNYVGTNAAGTAAIGNNRGIFMFGSVGTIIAEPLRLHGMDGIPSRVVRPAPVSTTIVRRCSRVTGCC